MKACRGQARAGRDDKIEYELGEYAQRLFILKSEG